MTTCADCKFWERYLPILDMQNENGGCRRRAPSVFNSIKNPHDEDIETVTAVWPTTFIDEWCGEHQLIKKQKALVKQVADAPEGDAPVAKKSKIIRKAMRRAAVLDATGWSTPTLYRKIKEGKFPAGSRLDSDGETVVWWEDEIAKLQEDAVKASRLKPKS